MGLKSFTMRLYTVSSSQPILKTAVPLSRKVKSSSVVSTLTYFLCSKPYSEDKKQGSQQSVIVTECLETFDFKPLVPIYLSFRDINTTVSTCVERTALMSYEPSVCGNISTTFFSSRYGEIYPLHLAL